MVEGAVLVVLQVVGYPPLVLLALSGFGLRRFAFGALAASFVASFAFAFGASTAASFLLVALLVLATLVALLLAAVECLAGHLLPVGLSAPGAPAAVVPPIMGIVVFVAVAAASRVASSVASSMPTCGVGDMVVPEERVLDRIEEGLFQGDPSV